MLEMVKHVFNWNYQIRLSDVFQFIIHYKVRKGTNIKIDTDR